MEKGQDLAQVPQAPGRLVWRVPRRKPIAFQHKKNQVGVRLRRWQQSRGALGPAWVAAGTETLGATSHGNAEDGQHHTPVPQAAPQRGPRPKRSGYRASGQCLPSPGKETVPTHGTGPHRSPSCCLGAAQPLCVGALFGLNIKGRCQGACSSAGCPGMARAGG